MRRLERLAPLLGFFFITILAVEGFYLPGLAPVSFCKDGQETDKCKVCLFHHTIWSSSYQVILELLLVPKTCRWCIVQNQWKKLSKEEF